jgi:hypothetical protein
MQMNPVPAIRLIFHVPGDNQHGFAFPRLEQPAFDGSAFVQTSNRMISPGVVELTGVPAGRYDIRLQGPGAGAQMNGVVLGKDGEEIDALAGETLSDVKVSVQIPGATSKFPQLAVGLRQGRRSLAGWHQFDQKGEAEIQQIPAGQYEVLVWSSPYSITRLSAEGAEVSGHTLIVKAASSPSLSITLAAGSAVIQGTAKRAGKGFAGAMVVLVPKNPEVNHDLFRRDQSDLDGTFSLRGLVPGSYTLLAIEEGWDLDWSRADVIAPYLKRGRQIEVGGTSTNANHQNEIIEVQSKEVASR